MNGDFVHLYASQYCPGYSVPGLIATDSNIFRFRKYTNAFAGTFLFFVFFGVFSFAVCKYFRRPAEAFLAGGRALAALAFT